MMADIVHACVIDTPHRVLVLYNDRQFRSLSWSNWLREIGGMNAHHAAVRDGRCESASRCRYEREASAGTTPEGEMVLSFGLVLALLISAERLTDRDLANLFALRTDADAAMMDVMAWLREGCRLDNPFAGLPPSWWHLEHSTLPPETEH